jgi:hypothetical protein
MKMTRKTLRSMIVSALMTALAIILPMAFHAVGLGNKFLPMLLPLLLNGFLSTWPWAILSALIAPWLSAALTGMPPVYPPIALVMSGEGIVLAGVASILYRATNRRVWPALVVAIVLSRVTGFLLMWTLAVAFHLPRTITATATLVEGLPGVALQIILTPIILRGLQQRRSLLFHEDD